MKIAKMNRTTVSKGYRLKPSTHRVVKKIQIQLNSTQDKVISSALRLYYSHLKKQLLINIK